MKFKLLTLFPNMFPGYLAESLAGDALEKGLWSYDAVDIKAFGLSKHRQVDDAPYGGGAGLVMRADVVEKVIESISTPARIIYMSPRGKLLNQELVKELSKESELTILCGRFEGIDERVLEEYGIEEISVGDYILSGGEPAALVLMDAVVRLLPGVLGNNLTHDEESFSGGLLEYPHYTRPAEWKGRKVPDILTSGDHKKVADWRKAQSMEITEKRRPDLLKK